MQSKQAVVVFLAVFVCFASVDAEPNSQSTQVVQEKVCAVEALCRCEMNDGGIIDLTGVGNLSFNITTSAGNAIYTYSPCKTFSIEGTNCTNVLACQRQPYSDTEYIPLATPDNFKFMKRGDNFAIEYSHQFSSTIRNMTVVLACDTKNDLIFNSQPGPLSYEFTLKSDSACMQFSTITPESSTTTPGGKTTKTTPESSSTTPGGKTTKTTPGSSTTTPGGKTTKTTPESSTTTPGGKTTKTTPGSSTSTPVPANLTTSRSPDTTTLGGSVLSPLPIVVLAVVAVLGRAFH